MEIMDLLNALYASATGDVEEQQYQSEQLAALRAEEERRSAEYHQHAMDEIAEKLGQRIHSDYECRAPWAAIPMPPEPPDLPAHITDPFSITGYEFQNLTREQLAKSNGAGRLSFVELVRLGHVGPHPTPYTQHLEFTRVYGLPIVVGKDEFCEGDLAIYLPLGTGLPPTKPLEFIHQNKDWEVRARRFRGVESCGVLLPTTDVLSITDTWTGRKSTASPDCWNVWLEHLLGADVSGWLGLRNPV